MYSENVAVCGVHKFGQGCDRRFHPRVFQLTKGNIIGDNNLIFLTVRSFNFTAKSNVSLIVCWFSASGAISDQVAS